MESTSSVYTKRRAHEGAEQSNSLPVPNLPSLEHLHERPTAAPGTPPTDEPLFPQLKTCHRELRQSLAGSFSFSPKSHKPSSTVVRVATIHRPIGSQAKMSIAEHSNDASAEEIPLIVRPTRRKPRSRPKAKMEDEGSGDEFLPNSTFSYPNKRRNAPFSRPKKKRQKKRHVAPQTPEVITLSDSDEEPSDDTALAHNKPSESASRYKSNVSLRPCAICADGKTFHRNDTDPQLVYSLSSKLEYSIDGTKHSIPYKNSEWEYAILPSVCVLSVQFTQGTASLPSSQEEPEPEDTKIPSMSQKLVEPVQEKEKFVMIFDADKSEKLREIANLHPEIELQFLSDESPGYTELVKISELYERALNRPKRVTRAMAKGKKRALMQENKVVLIWPPAPARDAVSITTSDLELLEPEVFLNDNIIDFYIKYIRRRMVSAEMKSQFYFFNCFLYKMITGNSLKPGSNILGWTGGVDISTRDFLILPINESMHWLLAIICFPREAEAYSKATTNLVENNYRPGILLFDSMASYSRNGKITKSIRKYLSLIWSEKESKEGREPSGFLFNSNNLPLRRTTVPQQSNGSDCGVFLLHFIEKFCEEPHWNPQKFNVEWFYPDEIEAKRKQIRNIVMRLKAESEPEAAEEEGNVSDHSSTNAESTAETESQDADATV